MIQVAIMHTLLYQQTIFTLEGFDINVHTTNTFSLSFTFFRITSRSLGEPLSVWSYAKSKQQQQQQQQIEF